MENYVAIDNVCAWPALSLHPGGAVFATIFNQPSHGRWEGDVECWASIDGGRLWCRRGIVAEHEPSTARVNHAAGMGPDGSLLALVSGFAGKPTYQEYCRDPSARPEISLLPLLICRSTDEGHTWQTEETAIEAELGKNAIPFGKIVADQTGALCACAYTIPLDASSQLLFLRSRDNGRTWQGSPMAGANYNETDLLWMGDDRWLAVSRTTRERHLEILISTDDGHTWAAHRPVTLPQQHPGNLCPLSDGRVLMTYGVRNHGHWGVGARTSSDAGETWSAPSFLAHFAEARDGGYPSSVQMPDGSIVTAYYADGIPGHRRYHMGVVIWSLPEFGFAKGQDLKPRS